jgi:hypothetical protein
MQLDEGIVRIEHLPASFRLHLSLESNPRSSDGIPTRVGVEFQLEDDEYVMRIHRYTAVCVPSSK